MATMVQVPQVNLQVPGGANPPLPQGPPAPGGGPAPNPGGGAGGGGGAPGGGGGPPGPGGAGGAIPPVIPALFAFSPARLQNRLLDYNSTADVKLYYKAVLPLEEKFDLSSEKIRGFLEAFYDRAKNVNWQDTLIINVQGVPLNLAKNYGSITLQQVQAHAAIYSALFNRDLQNSAQIYQCLSASLSTEAKAKVILESAKYTIADETDGLIFFKVIMSLAQVDTRATISVIRTRLSSIDSKIIELDDDIKEFNRYVKTNLGDLAARGENTTDLLVNLFKAYRLCKDEEFKLWLSLQEQAYYNGQDVTPEALMDQADNLYQSLIDTGKWHSESESQKRIVALTAQIQSMEKGQSKTHQATSKKPQSGKPPMGKSTNKNAKGKGQKGNNKFNPKKDDEPAWKTEAPASGDPQDKTVDGKDYHWCKYHATNGKWCRHTREKCDIKKGLEAQKGGKTAASATMRVNAAMVSILPEDDDY